MKAVAVACGAAMRIMHRSMPFLRLPDKHGHHIRIEPSPASIMRAFGLDRFGPSLYPGDRTCRPAKARHR
jgi:hypothetical protein